MNISPHIKTVEITVSYSISVSVYM